MTLERLSDYLGRAFPEGSYGRIFFAHQLSRLIQKKFQEEIRLSVKENIITLWCTNQAQASFYRLNRRKLYGLASSLGHKTRWQIRIKLTA